MKIIVSGVIIAFAIFVCIAVVLLLLMEALTKAEEIRKRVPWFVRYTESRGTLTHLLIVAILLLVGNSYEVLTKEIPEPAPPPLALIKAPVPPVVQVRTNPPSKERKDSLRRRTLQLADEMEKYFMGRARNPDMPPFAIPNSSVPNPSDDQKKAIELFRSYQKETEDYYFSHYKDRMVGIIKEYESKGVRTEYLESGAKQRPPAIFLQGSVAEGSYMDDLFQFRELAYHVDGDGNLIVIAL
jgi:hypothetical protein